MLCNSSLALTTGRSPQELKMRDRKFTQTEEIVNALEAGEAITALDALKRWGCFRLAARIGELRQEGYNIVTTPIIRDGKKFAEYRIV